MDKEDNFNSKQYESSLVGELTKERAGAFAHSEKEDARDMFLKHIPGGDAYHLE